MRKFKLLTQNGYDLLEHIAGKIYVEDYLPDGLVHATVAQLAKLFPHDWQEVTEEEMKLTDAEKIMIIGFLNDHFEEFCDFINDTGGYRGKPSNLIDKIEKL